MRLNTQKCFYDHGSPGPRLELLSLPTPLHGFEVSRFSAGKGHVKPRPHQRQCRQKRRHCRRNRRQCRIHTSDNVAETGDIVAETGNIVFLATMSPVLATMSNEISSLRQCRNKLNTFNLLRLCRTNEQQIAVECRFTYLLRCHSS